MFVTSFHECKKNLKIFVCLLYLSTSVKKNSVAVEIWLCIGIFLRTYNTWLLRGVPSWEKSVKTFGICVDRQLLFVGITELRLTSWWVLTQFCGSFAKLRLATIGSLVSVRPSVSMKQLGSHWMNCNENLYWLFFENLSRKSKMWLKSDKKNYYFSWRPIYIYGNNSLSYS